MKQLIVISIALLLAGCATSAKGTSSDATYMVEGDQYEIAECIVVEMDRLFKKWLDDCGILCAGSWADVGITDPVKHHSKKTGDNTYEVYYTGWQGWHDPFYYVKLTQVDNIVMIEQFTFWSMNISFLASLPKDSIEACI